MKSPVLIAGAGPVGLALALDLAWRGVPSLLVEPLTEVHPHPRAISIGVRTMEHFRRLGLDQKVIDAGVPRSRALDVIYVTRMLGREVFRFPIPSIDELARDAAALAIEVPEIAASPYYKTWTAQSPLERMLRAEVARSPQIEPRYGWRLDSFVESEEGVTASVVELATGRREDVDAQYLVGSDGANSVVRAGIGTRMSGRGTLGEAVGLYFKAPALGACLGKRPGVMYWVLAPGCSGVIYTIDGGDEWVFNRYFAPGETARAEEPVALIQRAIGAALDIEILSAQKWLPRQLVADRYQSARCFLAGDACHLFVPTGGFGMNTGIGDAVDLAWKIAARLEGWGGGKLLASYETERRPIGLFNTREAADNYDKSGTIFAVPDALEEEGAAGDEARHAIAAQLPPKIKHFAPIGVHLGSAYENSPLIVDDGTPPVPFDPVRYTPSTRPGQRAPHAWLAPGKSVLDLFGRGFTLLRFGGEGGDSLIAAARAAELPVNVVDIADDAVARLYERRLVLVRPDGHVAWRGDSPPAEPRAIIDRTRGA
ncbi:MAG TPA: FAD-dependent monooxygenase [Stellaceae bacterium]|jgi:2-polyprenyl-6-methoxyphenol hydroxylase-like FAD-dependent oxidoreductase|nr:FAD-dependent monooxygenase [Stellaceae bacterium]